MDDSFVGGEYQPPERTGTIYGRLVALIQEYLSQPTVRVIHDRVRSVLAKKDLLPDQLGAEELSEVVAEAMRVLRVFCDRNRLPDLMVDLAEFCDEVETKAGASASGRPSTSLPSGPSPMA